MNPFSCNRAVIPDRRNRFLKHAPGEDDRKFLRIQCDALLQSHLTQRTHEAKGNISARLTHLIWVSCLSAVCGGFQILKNPADSRTGIEDPENVIIGSPFFIKMKRINAVGQRAIHFIRRLHRGEGFQKGGAFTFIAGFGPPGNQRAYSIKKPSDAAGSRRERGIKKGQKHPAFFLRKRNMAEISGFCIRCQRQRDPPDFLYGPVASDEWDRAD